ncbi:Lipid A core - O-antigen ligase and related enzymes [Cedecea davisae]|uniref:O-antigen polymerase n=1 Tax=Cedecea davisae DSM 4568 TaxID=566551 RepID=S3IXT6_9ENTR|nr:Wzy polymerase domain-containing protein [Cedecea davisae]EPF17730.1 O-antigen polymerase [Cedecea davisae DSM 4568]SUX28047.1 Lipid A core - O-antigen ligase and related enzymes [Cedecea davisae]
MMYLPLRAFSRYFKRAIPDCAIVGMLALLLSVLLIIPWPTLPGTGLLLTINLITWIWVGLCGLGLCTTLLRRRLQGGQVAKLVFTGALLMSLPLMWTSETFRSNAFDRIAGLWGMAVFLCLLLQVPARGDLRRRIYATIVFAGLIQVGLSVWQLLFPASAQVWMGYDINLMASRPAGSLSQANQLGSFVATALACSVLLGTGSLKRKRYLHILNGLSTLLLSAGVILTQSRAMQAASVLAVVVLLVLNTNAVRNVGIWLIAGVITGSLLFPALQSMRQAADAEATNTQPVDYQARLKWNRAHSNNERFVMMQATTTMDRHHIFAGEGLGSFEVLFPKILSQNGVNNPFPLTVSHPHNEILYAWFEGGIVAVMGLFAWLYVGFMPFQRLLASGWRRLVGRGAFGSLAGRTVAARGAVIIPLIAHTMSEFPLYQSATHAVLLVVLVWLALPVRAARPAASSSVFAGFGLRVALTSTVALLSLAVIVFMATGLSTASQLRDAESFEMMDSTALLEVMNPWSQPDRLLFDRAVTELMVFSQTHDRASLDRFQAMAENWLGRHNDANLTWSLVRIARLHGNELREEYWRHRGCLSFSQDQRFQCQGSASVGSTLLRSKK